MNEIELLKQQKAACLEKMEKLLAGDADLTAEQQKEFDGLKAESETLSKKIERAEAKEKIRLEKERLGDVPKLDRRLATGQPGTGLPADEASSLIKIPATVKRWGQLKAFKGANADVQAYKAGMWIMACLGSAKAKRFCAEQGLPVQYLASAAQEEGSNVYGGYLVYDELDNTIIDLKAEYGKFRQNAKIVPMKSDVKTNPRRTGGLTAYWVGEGEAGTKSRGSWDQIKLIAKKLMALTKISNELSEDAIINIADTLVREIAYAFAYAEDEAGFKGDGTSTYGGITGVVEQLIKKCSSTGIATGTMSGGVHRYDAGYAFSNIDLEDDVCKMMSLLPAFPGVWQGAKFYGSLLFFYQVLLPMLTAAGQNSIQSIQDGPRGLRFLGYEYVPIESLLKTAAINKICLLFGNLEMAASLGDRRTTTIKFSEDATVDSQSVFERDEIAIRGTERLDINVHDVGSTSVAGPIVGLMSHTG